MFDSYRTPKTLRRYNESLRPLPTADNSSDPIEQSTIYNIPKRFHYIHLALQLCISLKLVRDYSCTIITGSIKIELWLKVWATTKINFVDSAFWPTSTESSLFIRYKEFSIRITSMFDGSLIVNDRTKKKKYLPIEFHNKFVLEINKVRLYLKARRLRSF